MCQLEMRRACVHKVCVVLVGCRRGAAADTGGGHSICIPIELGRGPSLSCAGVRGALTPLTPPPSPFASSPETQATRDDFGSATWTQGVAQNKPAAAQRCLERGGEGRGEGKELLGRTAHTTQPRQTKHCAAGWKKKGRAEPTYSRWVIEPVRKHGRQGKAKGGGGAFLKYFHW